jgi:hypothetical protein
VSLLCDFVYFSTFFCVFHCILPVPTPKYTIIVGRKGYKICLITLTSVILTPAWIPPPSYVDQLPGSINQSKVYRYDDFIFEVSFGEETTFSYIANPLCLYQNVIVHFHKISQRFARSVKTNLRSLLDELIHQMNLRHYMNSS